MAQAPTPEEVIEVLDRAIELMNDNGAHWTQGAFVRFPPHGDAAKYCSVGAIRKAAGANPDQGDPNNVVVVAAIQAVARATIPYDVGLRSEERGGDWAGNLVIGWNDSADTTWNKVVARFRRARARVEKRAKAGLVGF